MSPRPHRARYVAANPGISGMRPLGGRRTHGRGHNAAIVLMLEEYEALRLCDYEGLNHESAAARMQVSRPTFTRICTSARFKMAQALVEGLPVDITGGNVVMRSDQCVCPGCGAVMPHRPGVPCSQQVCEHCGARMTRE